MGMEDGAWAEPTSSNCVRLGGAGEVYSLEDKKIFQKFFKKNEKIF